MPLLIPRRGLYLWRARGSELRTSEVTQGFQSLSKWFFFQWIPELNGKNEFIVSKRERINMTIRYSFGGRDMFLFSYKWQQKWGFWGPCRMLFCPIHSWAHLSEVPAGLAGTGSTLGLLVITGYQVADMDNKGMAEKDIPWIFQNLLTAKHYNTIKFRLGKNYVSQRHRC